MSVDLGALKTAIQTLFLDANTATANPLDLSAGLAFRLKQILKVNPTLLPIQASYYPCLTVFVDKKGIEAKTIAKDQLTARRRASVTVKIVGVVWNNRVPKVTEDLADDECEKMMENAEQVLRANPTLAGAALWQMPAEVTYHTRELAEGAHLRAGILSLDVEIDY